MCLHVHCQIFEKKIKFYKNKLELYTTSDDYIVIVFEVKPRKNVNIEKWQLNQYEDKTICYRVFWKSSLKNSNKAKN